VVPDDIQPYDILIVRAFTEQTHAAFVKFRNNLVFGDQNEEPFFSLQSTGVASLKVKSKKGKMLLSESVNFVSALVDCEYGLVIYKSDSGEGVCNVNGGVV